MLPINIEYEFPIETIAKMILEKLGHKVVLNGHKLICNDKISLKLRVLSGYDLNGQSIYKYIELFNNK